jgi:hypothetical protein
VLEDEGLEDGFGDFLFLGSKSARASNWRRKSSSEPRASAPKMSSSVLTVRAKARRRMTSSVGWAIPS